MEPDDDEHYHPEVIILMAACGLSGAIVGFLFGIWWG